MAEVSDNESNEILTIIMKAECLNKKPSDWIDSSLSTTSIIILAMRVPRDVAPETCTFEFTASDNDKNAPMSITKQVQIKVLALYKPPEV